MAGKITELTAATSVDDATQIEAVQNGQNKRGTLSLFWTWLQTKFTGDNLLMTANERSKLAGIAANAEVNQTTAELQALVGAMFQSGTHTNASVVFDQGSGTISITASGGGGASLTQEEVEDFVGGVATQGTGINVTYDDAQNALIIALAGESFTTTLKNRLEAIEALADVTDTENVRAAGAPIKSSGTGAPSTTPVAVGDFYTDTSTGDLYHATGTTDANDWAQVLDASGGTVLSSGTPALADKVPMFDASDSDTPITATWTAILSALNILQSNVTKTLTKGYTHTPYDAGTQATGTFTPDVANGHIQMATNGGAHTLGVPADGSSIIVKYTNNSSAGAIDTSAFDKVDGNSLTTTDGHKFYLTLYNIGGDSTCTVKALQ